MRTSIRVPAVIVGTTVALLLILPSVALADRGNDRERKRDKLAFFDSRETPKARKTLRDRASALAESPRAAVEALQDALGSEGVVSIDPLTGTPRMVGRLDDFLTGPSSNAPAQVALDFARANKVAFGLSDSDLSSLELVRDYESIDGTHHLFFVQKASGVPIFGNGLKANVTKDGRLVNLLGSPVAAPGVASVKPGIPASRAVASARRDAEESIPPFRSIRGIGVRRPTTFANGDKASLVLFQSVDGLRLAWQTYVNGPGTAYLHVVDAASGAVLYRRSLVNYADGLVFDNYPGAARGGTQVKKSISRPGWLTSSSVLSGNNVHAYTDVNDDNEPNASEEVAPSSGTDWLFPLVPFTFAEPLNSAYGCNLAICTWNPNLFDPGADPGFFSFETNRAQSATQLFYLTNLFHDHLESRPIGFTDAAGNFQVKNRPGKGVGGDPLLAEALDGADTLCCFDDGSTVGMPDPNHTNNANMATPADGESPRMQMYLWHDPLTDAFDGTGADPFLPADGSNQAEVVFHEYTHGLSNRLVVDAFGNSTLGSIQAGAMGEAWSDWYAADYLVRKGLEPDTSAPGELSLDRYLEKNQYLIRTEPMDCPVGTTSAKCPGTGGADSGGYTYGDYGKIIGFPEVHADGEIWSQTLWDLRNALDADTSEFLVTRAMELSPANPSFLDMRNAILQADLISTGGRKRDVIWRTFATRGMGYFAATIDADDTDPAESFAMPPGRNARKGTLRGVVTDSDTGQPVKGVVVAFGGHASGFPGDFAAVSDTKGRYAVRRVFYGTYPKVSARGSGYDREVTDVTIDDRRNVLDFALRRDWAALGGGGAVNAFTGPDFTPFACGPGGAIDQSQGTGWGSTTDDEDGNETGNVTPKLIVIKLPRAVNITQIKVNPSNTCGDAGSASTKDYRIETSPNGTSWTTVKEGSFGFADRGQYVTIAGLGGTGLTGVQYVRFTMLNPQVPSSDGTLPPFGQSGVPERCGPGASDPGNFSGCAFMDMSELGIYGVPG